MADVMASSSSSNAVSASAAGGPDEHYPLRSGHSRGVIGTATMGDGTVLRTRHWAAGSPWAVALVVHGLSEHSGRYEAVGNWLSAAGIDAWAYDHRGWGASGGERGHVVRWGHYFDDLAEMLAAARAAHPGLPVVLYGHSMGGLISTGYVLDNRPLPDLLVLSAPGVESTHSTAVKTLARIFGRLVPRLRPPASPYEDGILSRDPEVDRLYRTDPRRVHDPTAAFGLAGLQAQAAAREAIDGMAERGASFPIPTLVLHGTADRLVPFGATVRYERVGGVMRRAYEGLRHELHNEPEGEAVVRDIVEWVRSRLDAAHG